MSAGKVTQNKTRELKHMLKIRPITFRDANAYVKQHHRHNSQVAGCKFAISCYEGERLCGVAICGRPIGRYLDDGETLEINRVCTDGTKNACSILYGACCRVAKDMGYRRVITYTLTSENGASVKASNFVLDAENVGGLHWTGKRGKSAVPSEYKNRWLRTIK